MELIVTLRKEIADQPEGEALFEWVKDKLKDKPEVKVTGMVNNHFEDETHH